MNFFREQLSNNKKQFISAGLILLAVLVAGSAYYYNGKKEHTYYAVFLTNNQVYFGNIYDRDNGYVFLRNAHYIQAQDPNNPQQIQLVKRGAELHLPTGTMKLNKSQVLFIEELSPDSQVVKTIEAAKN